MRRLSDILRHTVNECFNSIIRPILNVVILFMISVINLIYDGVLYQNNRKMFWTVILVR